MSRHRQRLVYVKDGEIVSAGEEGAESVWVDSDGAVVNPNVARLAYPEGKVNESSSLSCLPKQVKDWNAKLERAGIRNAKHLPDGTLVFDGGWKTRRRLMKHYRKFDMAESYR